MPEINRRTDALSRPPRGRPEQGASGVIGPIIAANDYQSYADAGFTLRTYTHLVASSHERARQAIDAVFGRPESSDGLEAA
ncbi:hypothetical protein [Amycolatopsis rhizosphaerae]|uniref:hypothetical protein n=1 Tax=Amycolatopsis rhizosphaerae TaxID=2053003 RepID=UPI001C988452|nr:hypothetical protein [Amycolatopsis rhizosphaerae]